MKMIFWFTGLSGSGKTTIAHKLKKQLESLGKRVSIIDGDEVRNTTHRHLGFSREDIQENIRLITELAMERKKINDVVIVSVISPHRADRELAREKIGSPFVEIFVNASLDTCIKRDVKGLYKKALAGEIDNFIGISKSTPYEPPDNPDITVDTQKVNVNKSVKNILAGLCQRGIM